MHAGTLTTTYHFRDHGRKTAIRVETLVSQASPHLGATRLQITPDYDGVVQLSFGFTLWSQHAPRFSMAQITGPEMDQAVVASGQSFEAHPPAAADREAVWYPGYVEIGAAEGDRDTRSLWLNGQAAQGKSMAMAGAIALPWTRRFNLFPSRATAWRLSLDVSIKVQRGHQYDFSKFVAFSREGWGSDAAADLQLARQARDQGFEHLLADQRAAWSKLWESDIQVEGDRACAASGAFRVVSTARRRDARYWLGPGRLCVNAGIFQPHLLGQRHVGVSGAVAATPGACQVAGDFPANAACLPPNSAPRQHGFRRRDVSLGGGP